MLFCLNSCSRTVDDTNINCFSNCTTIQGYFVHSQNQGVSNIPLEFSSEHKQELTYYSRKIKEGNSSEDGFYSLDFYLEDREVSGYYNLMLQSDLGQFNSYEEFFGPSDYYDSGYWNIINFSNGLERDSNYTFNFYLPQKAKVPVRLENFSPDYYSDYCKVYFRVPCGEAIQKGDVFIPIDSLGATVELLEVNETDTTKYFPKVPMALNDTTILIIHKRVNSVYSNEMRKVYLTDDDKEQEYVISL